MARITHDLTGQTFGLLTIIRKANQSGAGGMARWLVRCICGKEKFVYAQSLMRGTKSCGVKCFKTYYKT
jgi:hypothetical protein